MKIIENSISLDELQKMSENMYGELVKAVVDIEKEIIAVDAPMHADQEKVLLDRGSKQQNLWGINLYPEFFGEEDFLEFDSMINLRPSMSNYTRGIENENIKAKISDIVSRLVKE